MNINTTDEQREAVAKHLTDVKKILDDFARQAGVLVAAMTQAMAQTLQSVAEVGTRLRDGLDEGERAATPEKVDDRN